VISVAKLGCFLSKCSDHKFGDAIQDKGAIGDGKLKDQNFRPVSANELSVQIVIGVFPNKVAETVTVTYILRKPVKNGEGFRNTADRIAEALQT
jgi:hypothetical protein